VKALHVGAADEEIGCAGRVSGERRLGWAKSPRQRVLWGGPEESLEAALGRISQPRDAPIFFQFLAFMNVTARRSTSSCGVSQLSKPF
jgi:hypothetical protein